MFDGMDMNSLLAQAQQMQEQLAKAQEELAAKTYTGTAGGELVSVKLSGSAELLDVTIAPEACDPDDTETLSALIVAAVRDAKQQLDSDAAAAVPQLPEGLGF